VRSDTLRLLYLHEIRMLVRARRTVVMAVVIPLILMPIMLFASKFTADQRQRSLNEATYRYAVTGEWAGMMRGFIADARESLDGGIETDLDELGKFRIREVSVADPARSLEQNEIHFYIETSTAVEEEADRPKGVPVARIVYFGSNDASNDSSRRMESLLHIAQRRQSENKLTTMGFRVESGKLFHVEAESLATPEQLTGSTIGRTLTPFLLMLMLSGGSIAAMDIISGEKERGTLETLLSTAATRTEIVTAKQLTICSVALLITAIQALNFLVYIKLQVVALPQNFALALPLSRVLTLLLLFVPLAATVAAILLMVSGYAKTYKEAQMYFVPVFVMTLIPSFAAMLPALRLRSAIAFVPISNVSVAVREIMVGRSDPPFIIVTFIVTALAAVFLLRASSRMLSREEMTVTGHLEPELFLSGPALFERHVWRWFAVMWAVIFATALNVPAISSLRGQVVFNQLIIFLGSALLIIRIYRLDFRDALSLRSVHWPVWLAAAIAAPTGNLVAVAVLKLVNYIVPAPTQLLQQMESMMPSGMPRWQIYLAVAVIPGVIEELTFRGVLLYGLRRKVRPILLPLVVGIAFGIFHFALFRMAPTAFLGVLLTIVAMLTNSIFPAMLMHILSNAFAIWASDHDWPVDALLWWHYALSAVIFALAMWIIYRNRRIEGQ
jgi:sodium transport system permease protein